jgi:hypothetical protein
MEFSPEIGFWSPFIFWFCLGNAILSILFTFVVIVGGAFDLRFLLNSLKNETPDATDDGRVDQPQTHP